MSNVKRVDVKETKMLKERAVLVSGLQQQLIGRLKEEKINDRLMIHFQKKSNGGGDVEKVKYPLPGHPSEAIVIFSGEIVESESKGVLHALSVLISPEEAVLPKCYQSYNGHHSKNEGNHLNQLTYLYKVINNVIFIQPSSLKPKITRSRRGNSCQFNEITANTDVYLQSFLPSTVRRWNKLPQETINAPTHKQFRSQNPPLPGPLCKIPKWKIQEDNHQVPSLDSLIRRKHVINLTTDIDIPVDVRRLPEMIKEVKIVVDDFYMSLVPRDKMDDLSQKLKESAGATLEQSNGLPTINIPNMNSLKDVQHTIFKVAGLQDKEGYNGNAKKESVGSFNEDGYSGDQQIDKTVGHHENTSRPQSMKGVDVSNVQNDNRQALQDQEDKVLADQADSAHDVPPTGTKTKRLTDGPAAAKSKHHKSPVRIAAEFSIQEKSKPDQKNVTSIKCINSRSKSSASMGIASEVQASDPKSLGQYPTEDSTASQDLQTDVTFSANSLIFHYLEVKQKHELDKIRMKYGVKITCSTENSMGGQGQVHISKDKFTKKDNTGTIHQASQAFISLFQSYLQCITFKTIPCKGIDIQNINEAQSIIWTEHPDILVEDSIDEEVTLVGWEKDINDATKIFQKITGHRRKLKHPSDVSWSSWPSSPMNTGVTEFDSNGSKFHHGGARPRTAGWQRIPSKAKDENFKTTEGILVIVRKDDISKQCVNVIVNASNRELTHGSGVAGALSDEAGKKLQDECDGIRRRSGPLAVAQCVDTPGYQLQCDSVVHAVGPRYEKHVDENVFFNQLKETFANCFTLASHLKAKSVAVPLISSGSFDGPKKLCAKALVGAIKQYSKMESRKTIEAFLLVNIDDKANDAIVEALKGFLKDDDQMEVKYAQPNTPLPHFWKETLSTTSKGNGTSNSEHTAGKKLSDFQEVQNSLPDKTPTVLFATRNVHIIVVQQDLPACSRAAEVLIVPTDNMLSNDSEIGRNVEKAAGVRLRTECCKIMERKSHFPLQNGEIVHTPGYNLPCKHLIFVVFPVLRFFSNQEEFSKELIKVVCECIKYADENLHSKSFALPLFPSDVDLIELCSAAFATAIHRFMNMVANIERILVVSSDERANMALRVVFADEFKSDKGSIDIRAHEIPSDGMERNPHGAEGVDYQQLMRNNSANFSQSSKRNDQDEESDGSEDESDDKKCPICLDEFDDTKPAVTLDKCKHKFCRECKDEAMKRKPVCPVCGVIYGVMRGNQPDGTMSVRESAFPSLPGYEGCGTITIAYYFPDGKQGADHPSPGQRYRGTSRTAYLPNNTEGKKVVRLLRKAFDARLIFTVGTSVTTGARNTVTWNDIHHKTNISGGAQGFGYPDPTYLQRVTEELAAKGIK